MKMNIAEYKGVFVFAQQVDNKLSGIARQRKRSCKGFEHRGYGSIGWP